MQNKMPVWDNEKAEGWNSQSVIEALWSLAVLAGLVAAVAMVAGLI